jgi:hypothetical protein
MQRPAHLLSFVDPVRHKAGQQRYHTQGDHSRQRVLPHRTGRTHGLPSHGLTRISDEFTSLLEPVSRELLNLLSNLGQLLPQRRHAIPEIVCNVALDLFHMGRKRLEICVSGLHCGPGGSGHAGWCIGPVILVNHQYSPLAAERQRSRLNARKSQRLTQKAVERFASLAVPKSSQFRDKETFQMAHKKTLGAIALIGALFIAPAFAANVTVPAPTPAPAPAASTGDSNPSKNTGEAAGGASSNGAGGVQATTADGGTVTAAGAGQCYLMTKSGKTIIVACPAGVDVTQ